MKTKIITGCLIVITTFSLCLLISCDSKSLTYPQPQQNSNEFIVLSSSIKGFKVINIHSSAVKSVPAVKELGGRVYLPIFSSMPTFDRKVVEGIFVPDTNYYLNLRDTIFHVTKHLRDTTISTVGH